MVGVLNLIGSGDFGRQLMCGDAVVQRGSCKTYGQRDMLRVAHPSRVLVIASRDHELVTIAPSQCASSSAFWFLGARRLPACSWLQLAANHFCTCQFSSGMIQGGLS